MAEKKVISTGAKVALGALALAGIAGGYFLYGKDGAKNRKKIKAWGLKAKAEVLEKIEKAKEMGEADYQALVDSVAEKYSKLKDMDPAEVAAFAKEMKSHWKSMKTHLAPKAKKAVKKAVKTAKAAAAK
jgi:hypothetical protein